MSQSQTDGRNLIPYVLGGVALVALLAVIVVSLSGSDDGEGATAPVEVSGAALAPFAEGADSAVGLPIPEAFGTDFADQDVSIQADGTPQAIIFLAHWCPHCQNEVSEITSFLEDGGSFPEGVDVVSVSTSVDSTRGNFPPSTWLDDEGWPFEVLRDDDNNTVSTAYGMSGTPFWVFVDADGNVSSRASGEIGVSGAVATMEGLLTDDGGSDTAGADTSGVGDAPAEPAPAEPAPAEPAPAE